MTEPVGAFTIPESHPSLPGHFPGRPVVPGVVLLDEIAALIVAASPGCVVTGFPAIRFNYPVRPGDRVIVAFAAGRFTGTVNGDVVVQGRITLE